MTTSPPVPLLTEPTVRYIDPPRPPTAVPDPKYTAPLFPIAVIPDPSNKAPLFPMVALPVLKSIRPLVPVVPELAVLNKSEPLLVPTPKPVTREICPPVTPAELPAD